MATGKWVEITKYLQQLEGRKPNDRTLVIVNQGKMHITFSERNAQYVFKLEHSRITMHYTSFNNYTDATREPQYLRYDIRCLKDVQRNMHM